MRRLLIVYSTSFQARQFTQKYHSFCDAQWRMLSGLFMGSHDEVPQDSPEFRINQVYSLEHHFESFAICSSLETCEIDEAA